MSNLFEKVRADLEGVLNYLVAAGDLPDGLNRKAVSVESPRDPTHGDLATNAALVLSKAARVKPRDLAEKIAAGLTALARVEAAEVAGPGFINLRMTREVWHAELKEILDRGADYGRSAIGAGRKINVEFVSANPTGPLHVGHSRGAVFGDALASLLTFTGYDVSREYYINDAGSQIAALARSVYHRYLEALGDAPGPMPEGLYPGDYLVPVAEGIVARDGDKWRGTPETDWLPVFRDEAVSAMMVAIRGDLDALGIHFDVFSSEAALVADGKVDEALEVLTGRGLIYTGVLDPPKGKRPDDWEPRPQTLFRSSQFGDDVDRPLKKSDGSWTYFATDTAYHLDKFRRGFAEMIDVWGADHGGYVKRMKAAVTAITDETGALDVKICQLVNLLDDGRPIKMSKRAGQFVTVRGIVDAVGKDVVRFIMLTRRNDASLDFDVVKVTEQSRDNPVFYVHYAHARICSVLRNALALGITESGPSEVAESVSLLRHPDELGIVKLMAAWPRVIEGAADAHEPHRLAFYLYDLASAFHALWNKGNEDPSLRFIVEDDLAMTRARLALLRGVQSVIACGLGVIGVTPVEEMR